MGNNEARTSALGQGLAALYQIQPKNIEIGGTLVHKYGAIVHIVHMVSKSELDTMEQELDGDGINVMEGFTQNNYVYPWKMR